MRRFSSNIYRGLKTATKSLIDGFGGQKIASDKTRVDIKSLSNYGNHANHEMFMPVDVAIDLMEASGDFEMLEYIAGIFGLELIEKPTGEAGMKSAPKVMCAIKEMSEAQAIIAGGILGEHFTGDRNAARKELEEAAQAIANLLRTFDAKDSQNVCEGDADE